MSGVGSTERHRISIVPGISAWLRMTYQAECECGWRGDWWPSRLAAEEQGDAHESGDDDA